MTTVEEQQRGAHLPHDVLGAHDALRFGLPTLKADALPVHPAQVIQETNRNYQTRTKRYLMEKAYGTALPLQMQMEQQILSKFQRPQGLIPSSMLGLESLTGTLDEIGFEDSFGDIRESESFVPVDMHHAMEVRLGLAKGGLEVQVQREGWCLYDDDLQKSTWSAWTAGENFVTVENVKSTTYPTGTECIKDSKAIQTDSVTGHGRSIQIAMWISSSKFLHMLIGQDFKYLARGVGDIDFNGNMIASSVETKRCSEYFPLYSFLS